MLRVYGASSMSFSCARRIDTPLQGMSGGRRYSVHRPDDALSQQSRHSIKENSQYAPSRHCIGSQLGCPEAALPTIPKYGDGSSVFSRMV